MRHEPELRSYQQRTVSYLYEHDAALCVIRPGGGKTVSALTAIKELLDDGVIRHALVIAPKRVARYVWPDEIAGWEHLLGLEYKVLTGKPSERLHMLARCAERDITIIGIDLVGWLLDNLKNVSPNHPIFDLLVIDEVSKLRNPTGVRAKRLAKECGRWRAMWGLSGTLRPSSALDLFMPSRIVTDGQLWGKSFYTWRQKYFYPIDWNQYQWTPKPGMEDLLNADIAPWTTTIQEDEMVQLPSLSIVFDKIQLPPGVRKEYENMHHTLVAKLPGPDNVGAVIAANAAVASGKLAQIANGFVYGEDGAADVNALHDEKRTWLADLVEDTDQPLLLIYWFVEDLAMINDVLGYEVPRLGQGVSDKQADANIAMWNMGKLPVMAMHPAAGGHGLNLQDGGCDMAWICPTWSPELWEQTIARLHRSGQTKPVVVRVCVAENTVDEMKVWRVHDKMSAQAAFERYLREHGAGVKGAAKPSR